MIRWDSNGDASYSSLYVWRVALHFFDDGAVHFDGFGRYWRFREP